MTAWRDVYFAFSATAVNKEYLDLGILNFVCVYIINIYTNSVGNTVLCVYVSLAWCLLEFFLSCI
jgi:hypothetical protein